MHTRALMVVMLWILTRIRCIVIIIVMMIMLTNLMTNITSHRMQVRYAQAHTQEGEKQEQYSEQTRHLMKINA